VSNVIPRFSEGNKVEFNDKVAIWLNRAAGVFSKDARPVTPADFAVTTKDNALLLTWTPDTRADFYNVYASSTNDVNAKLLLERLYGDASSFIHYLGGAETRYYWLEACTNTGRVGELVQSSGTSTAPSGGGGTTSTSVFASRPAAGNAGNLFFPSDGVSIERDNGTIWVPWGPIYPFTAPIDGDFAWINQGSATVTAEKDTILLTPPTGTSGHNWRIRKKAAPATPYTITAIFKVNNDLGNANDRGAIGFRQSSDGKLVTLGVALQNPPYIDALDWTDPTTYGGTTHFTNTPAATLSYGLFHLRIEDDGTNRKYYYSTDGILFILLLSHARTTFLTADEVFFGSQNFATNTTTMRLLSWKQA